MIDVGYNPKFSQRIDEGRRFLLDLDRMLRETTFDQIAAEAVPSRPPHLIAHLRWVRENHIKDLDPAFNRWWGRTGTFPAGAD